MINFRGASISIYTWGLEDSVAKTPMISLCLSWCRTGMSFKARVTLFTVDNVLYLIHNEKSLKSH